MQAFCKNAILALLVLLLAALGTSAQTLDRGAVHGFVYDASGSAIPGVKVTLTSPATGLKREITTNADGGYDFEALTPGQYILVFESGNFATYTVKQIVITIGSSIALDAHMKLKTAEGEELSVKHQDGKVWIVDAKGGTSMVTISNVNQSNGVIHVVDTVLMPAS